MVVLAVAEGRAARSAAAVVTSYAVAVLLYAWLLMRYVEGQANFYYWESGNVTGELCQQLYSCDPEMRRARPPGLHGACSCHDYCRVAGDCCADKTPPASLSLLPSADAYRCISLNTFAYPVRMVTACPSPTVDAQVANFCATPISLESQPDFLFTPVTDRVSGLTYRNIYCARCWGVADRRVKPWLWKFTCDEDNFGSFYYNDMHEKLKCDKVDATSAATTPTSTVAEHDSRNMSSVSLCLRDLCHLVYAPPPDVVSNTHNCTARVIDSCADPGADEDSRRKCASGATAIVYVSNAGSYKNAACAACSTKVPRSFYRCLPEESSHIASNQFDILLSASSGCCITLNGQMPQDLAWPFPWLCQGQHRCPSDDSSAENAAAALPHVVLPIANLEERRRMSANTTSSCTYTKRLKSYAPSFNVTYATFANDTLVLVVNESATLCVLCSVRRCTNFTATNLSLDCTADGQLYHYDYPLFVVEGDAAVACADARTNARDVLVNSGTGCPAIPEVVSIVSLCLSEVCLIAFFVVFALLKDQRRFPQELILNQSIAFFLAFLFFLLRPVVSESTCKALAATIHYFLLSAFAWTALFAVQVTRVLSSVPLRSARSPFRWRLVSYTLGWLLPLVCLGLGLAADAEHLNFKPDYGPPQCFISNPLGNVTLFVAPMGIFLLVDVVAYCYMIIRLIKVARQTAVVRKSHYEKLFLCIKLVLCLGLLWISGVVAAFTGSQVAYCIFTLFNSLQGVFTFIIFACKQDTLISLRSRSTFFRPERPFNSSTATTRSTIVAIQLLDTNV